MELLEIPNTEFSQHEHLFESHPLNLLIRAALRQETGKLWTDAEKNTFLYNTRFFSAFSGDNADSHNFFEYANRHRLLLFPTESWINGAKKHYGFRFIEKKDARFSFGTELDLNHLRDLRKQYEEKYDYSDFQVTHLTQEDHVPDSFVEYFEMFYTQDNLWENGNLMVVKDKDGLIVSIAGQAHPDINKHYELQVATDPKYRSKGLGMLVCIDHLIYALNNGYIPHWDAATPISSSMAQKLGYGKPTSYSIYLYTSPLIQILRKSKIPKLIVIILTKLKILKE
ncbi:MAG: GNAT family N-acetyltransferase [Candidatus Heimdallarchaeota archaeon]|nr:GNAT family N-acetyltransferase [Candidatus Heimdallarchaeota archaeon]